MTGMGNDLVKGITKKSLFILLPIALLSAFIDWRMLPAGIILGGVLCLVNLRGLAWGIEALIKGARPKAGVIFFSLLRLFFLFSIIFLVVKFNLVNIFGLVIGFTVVFAMIIIEGLRQR